MSYGPMLPQVSELDHPQILLVPGFGEGKAHLSSVAAHLEVWGTEVFIDSLEGDYALPGSGRLHAVGHSIGAISLLEVAIKEPERFASVTLMEPMGLCPEQSLPSLMLNGAKKYMFSGLRATQQFVNQLQRGAAGEDMVDFWKGGTNQFWSAVNVARNPIGSARQLLGSAGLNITENVQDLRLLGLPVEIILAAGDEIFDPQVCHKICVPLVEDGVTYTWLARRDANHDAFWLESANTARLIKQIVASLL